MIGGKAVITPRSPTPVYVYVYGEKTKTGGRVIRQAQFLTRTRSQVFGEI